tara:strand:- start:1305 stop:1589 length:285 start_codon:yes stop_codon:yes gene_type:complete
MSSKKKRIISLDMHGIKHKDVKSVVDAFIFKNKENLPLQIITGKSIPMRDLVSKALKEHNLYMRATQKKPWGRYNLGCYIVDKKFDSVGGSAIF